MFMNLVIILACNDEILNKQDDSKTRVIPKRICSKEKANACTTYEFIDSLSNEYLTIAYNDNVYACIRTPVYQSWSLVILTQI